eukprot:CAMPEP_0197521832 /NCGR_PEP_ID=MMETSP1318-20131121/7055_1 /TAXON_ID=552666 /ORGANISM="Partenskyella glossopodia, Strain RCC365" /LENGTH=327 /DNA_ID=CAMNT_0043073969 /DNA_START=32 /DNA_END=1015 /DNA_ORIENTATION=+
MGGACSGKTRTKASGRPSWQQTMLRVKDPKASVQHYQGLYGMTLLDTLEFPEYKFSLYFLASIPAGVKVPTPGTPEAHRFLWSFGGTTLELTHNWGREEPYHPGNQKNDGFGHIAFACDDVYEASNDLEKAGVAFKKKPDEGRMKGLAFAYDPDKYWVEIVKRPVPLAKTNLGKYTLKQTMLRVKDPTKSLVFYQKFMGMVLVKEKHFDDFSLYFLATAPPGSTEADAGKPVLELTHNHGTELDEKFKHYNGNEKDRQGFGHLGFLVDDVYAKCKELEKAGYTFKKTPDGGSMKGLAFVYDPDGYPVELIKRGGYDADGTPYYMNKE